MCMLLVNVSAILIECICRNNPASLPAFTLTFLRVSVWRRVPHIQVFRFCRVYLLIFRDFLFLLLFCRWLRTNSRAWRFFFVCVFLSLQCYFISLSELAVDRCPKASYGDLIWGLSGQSTFDMIFFFFFWRFGTKLRNNSPLVHSYLKKKHSLHL